MELINTSKLSEDQQQDLLKRVKASARMRKGIATSETIDFTLEDETIVKGRFIQNATVFAIE